MDMETDSTTGTTMGTRIRCLAIKDTLILASQIRWWITSEVPQWLSVSITVSNRKQSTCKEDPYSFSVTMIAVEHLTLWRVWWQSISFFKWTTFLQCLNMNSLCCSITSTTTDQEDWILASSECCWNNLAGFAHTRCRKSWGSEEWEAIESTHTDQDAAYSNELFAN